MGDKGHSGKDSKGKGKGKGGGKPQGKPSSGRELSNKLKLSNAYERTHHVNLKRGEIAYENVEGADGLWVSTVSHERFSTSHESVGNHSDSRGAEESAALVALGIEYPDEANRAIKYGAAKISWKVQLAQAYEAEHGEPPTKENLFYTFTDRDEGFICAITCDRFETVHEIEEVYDTKMKALEAVSKVALEAEFPAMYAAGPQPKRQRVAAPADFSTKRADKSDADKDPKSRLSEGMMVILGRSVKKGEVEYEVQETPEGLVCTLSITRDEGVSVETFTGAPVEVGSSSKEVATKEAQRAAARVAMETLQEAVEEARPEHEARRAEKQAKLHAEKRLTHELKIAERQAEEGAGGLAGGLE